MKPHNIRALFCLLFLLSGYAQAEWAPGDNTIQADYSDSKSNAFSLAMDKPVVWEVEQGIIGNIFNLSTETSTLTLFSMNTYGGWDVGYEYSFSYNFGEGIDVGPDGWSYPELMTRADLNIGAKAWLKLTSPGLKINIWKVAPLDLNLLELLGLDGKIEEEISIPAGGPIESQLPFLGDNISLFSLDFKNGIYNDDYDKITSFDLKALVGLPTGVTARVGVARGLEGDIQFGLNSISYYNNSSLLGSQSSAFSGVDVAGYSGQTLNINQRNYNFRIQPTVGAGIALYGKFGIWGWDIETYYPLEGSEPPNLISAKVTTAIDLPPLPINIAAQYAVPSQPTGDTPTDKDNGSGNPAPPAITADALEANNSNAAAVPVTAFPYNQQDLSIHHASDQDYFALDTNVIGFGRVTVQALFENVRGDLDIYLFDPSGALVVSGNTTTNNENIALDLSDSGIYHLVVEGYASATNRYDLSIAFSGDGSLPTADMGTQYAGVTGSPVLFDGSASTTPTGSITSYRWIFGDGSTTTTSGPAVSHTYQNPGVFVATLIVTNGSGATDSSQASVTIAEGGPNPALISFSANPLDESVSLDWVYPQGFDSVLLIRSEDPIHWQPQDGVAYSGEIPGVGEVAISGQFDSYFNRNLTNDQIYYYAAYVIDSAIYYSSPSFVDAMPQSMVDSPFTTELDSPGSTYLSGDIFGDLHLKTGTLYIDGVLRVHGNLIHSGGTLKVNGGSLIVDGDYRIQRPNGTNPDGSTNYTYSYGYLDMRNAQDQVLVHGDFVMDSANGHSGFLTAGVLEVKGDFTQRSSYPSGSPHLNFSASGGHRVLLSGSEGQNVSMEDPTANYSHFNILEITNGSAEGITYLTRITVNDLQSIGHKQTGLILYQSNWTLAVDETVVGDVVLQNGTILNLNGRQLTIQGDLFAETNSTLILNGGTLHVESNLIHSGGTLQVKGGTLIVDHDYRIQSPNGTNPDGSTNYTYSYGYLDMRNAQDRVVVHGDFVMDSANGHSGFLTAGVLEVKGDFTQRSSYTNYSHLNFSASGSHRVLLSGSEGQNVSMEDPTANYSHFNILEITNRSFEGVLFTTNIVITKLFNHHGNYFIALGVLTAPDFDGDGLTDDIDPYPLDQVPDVDSDNDGLKDAEEIAYGTDPDSPDSDGDGDKDGDEVAGGSDPMRADDTLDDHRPDQPLLDDHPDNVPLTGLILTATPFSDPDAGDTLYSDHWQIAMDITFNEIIFDRQRTDVEIKDNGATLPVPDGLVGPGGDIYWARLSHRDDKGLWSYWSDPVGFVTPLTDENDLDGDGRPDDSQIDIFTDLDGNSVSDSDQGMLRIYAGEQNRTVGFLLANAPAGSTLLTLAPVSIQQIPEDVRPSGPAPYGLFSFSVALPEGYVLDPENPETITIEIYFEDLIPHGTQWIRYDPVTDSVLDISDDTVVNGNIATITITDGGSGDFDGLVNGFFVDPVGPVVPDGDIDEDTIPDSQDNCIYRVNQNQTDRGGVNTSEPDGIGDACQCGDMNGDGFVTNTDAVLIQRNLVGLPSPFNLDLCDVNGDGNCTNTDAVIIKRAVLGLPPGVVQRCGTALPSF